MHGLHNPNTCEVRTTDEAYFARFDETLARTKRFRDRYFSVLKMKLEQIDVIGLQSTKAILA